MRKMLLRRGEGRKTHRDQEKKRFRGEREILSVARNDVIRPFGARSDVDIRKQWGLRLDKKGGHAAGGHFVRAQRVCAGRQMVRTLGGKEGGKVSGKCHGFALKTPQSLWGWNEGNSSMRKKQERKAPALLRASAASLRAGGGIAESHC